VIAVPGWTRVLAFLTEAVFVSEWDRKPRLIAVANPNNPTARPRLKKICCGSQQAAP